MNITQNTMSDGKVCTTVEITRVIDRKYAQKFVDGIDRNKTFYNFSVEFYPVGGQETVAIKATHHADINADDIVKMLLSVMFDIIEEA